MLDGGSFPPASPIPACLSECPLPYQQHARASLSLSPAAPLCSRRDPAWLPWRPGVTHAAGSAQAATGHMLHYFALPVHLSLSRFAWYFFSLPRSEWKTLMNVCKPTAQISTGTMWVWNGLCVEHTATGLTSVWWWWHVQCRLCYIVSLSFVFVFFFECSKFWRI